jgi:flagellar basal-body rod modification protein FlgD
MANSIEGGSGNTLADYLNNSSSTQVRKVGLSIDENGKISNNVINEGDTNVFKDTANAMGKDQFLNLLVAQLQHQDPLNPAEDTQFVAQLAQFSQLEFTQNSTAAISALANNMQAFMELQTLQAQSITNSSATPLLGKDVRVMESTFKYSGSGSRDFNIYLPEGFKQGTVVVKDKGGEIVAELDVSVEGSKGGEAKVTWNGKDKNTGDQLLGGDFSVEVMDVTGSKKIGYAFQDGKVTGIDFSNGAALTVNDVQYGIGYLVKVSDVKTSV